MKTGRFTDIDSARRYLAASGKKPDSDIDLYETALALSMQNHPGLGVDQYRSHFKTMCGELEQVYEDLAAERNGDTLAVRAESLRRVMAQRHGYIGDDIRYDDLQNADLVRVVDRRLGLPITLSLIAIALCRATGWQAEGLNFPGHFLMRLDHEGDRAVLDPFQACVELQAADLRTILKRTMGAQAELSAGYYSPCSNRDILMRLQNNIKLRLIDGESYQEALDVVETMRLIAPGDYRIDLDCAVLLARLERPRAAVTAIMRYIDGVPDPQEKSEAQAFLRELEASLN